MKINGKDIKFEYTIGAMCDYMDYCAGHPEVSLTRAVVYQALFCNRAYAQLHEGSDTITMKELESLPMWMHKELEAEVRAAVKAGSERTVETVENKDGKKNINEQK